MGNIRPLATLLSKDYTTCSLILLLLIAAAFFNVAAFICQENMFSFEVEKERYALKPMNCPGHWYVFLTVCLSVLSSNSVDVKGLSTGELNICLC